MKSSLKLVTRSFLLLLLAGSSTLVLADEAEPRNLSITLGLKVWANDWQSWNFPGQPQLANGDAVSLSPSLTVKYGRFFVTVGAMPETTYSIPNTTTGATSEAKRKEADLSAGYYIHPQVAVMLLNKQISQTWSQDEYIWSVTGIGIAAASAVQETNWFMFGNAAIGRATVSAPSAMASWKMEGGHYSASEVGLGYAFSQKFRVTFGYKVQASPTSMEASTTTSRVYLMDTTRGFVLGTSYTF